MRPFFVSLFAAFLLLGLCISPVAAGPSASELCGSQYTVQHLDNLTKIASLCETTVEHILSLNPQISNPNIIYSGQVLRLSGRPTSYGTTYTVVSGDTLQEIADMFDTTIWAILQANPGVWDDSDLDPGMVLNIPSSGTYTGYSGSPRVSLSRSTGGPGDSLTIYVRGFPANSWIDYRIGEQDEDYSVVYDGTVGPDGTDSITITIPSAADRGEYWVVLVTTTSQKNGVEATSSRIYINE